MTGFTTEDTAQRATYAVEDKDTPIVESPSIVPNPEGDEDVVYLQIMDEPTTEPVLPL